MNVLKAISVIDSLREGWYIPPTNYNKKRKDFDKMSFQRTAMDEIRFYLMEHASENPVDTIEKFRRMMDEFSCRPKSDDTSFMFSVYYDVATDVLDVLLGMK